MHNTHAKQSLKTQGGTVNVKGEADTAPYLCRCFHIMILKIAREKRKHTIWEIMP